MVRTPDGAIRLDPIGRSAGRGAYVCRDIACITTATERGLLSRALTSPIPPTVMTELLAALPSTVGPSGGFLGQE